MATLKLTTTLGTQYTDVGFTRTDAYGAKLLAGTGSLAGTTARFAVGETNSDVRTLGFLGREQVAWRDRVFLTGAVRTRPQQRVRRELPPRLLSVGQRVVGGERRGVLPEDPARSSSLRLRAAVGSAGQNPGYLAAEQFYNSGDVDRAGPDVPAFTVGGAGNPNLKPEKSTETEGGLRPRPVQRSLRASSTRTTTRSRATSW